MHMGLLYILLSSKMKMLRDIFAIYIYRHEHHCKMSKSPTHS